jgi:hypothetical protein
MGKVPEHQRGTAQRLGRELIEGSNLPKPQQRAGVQALRNRPMWQHANKGGGQVSVPVKPPGR